MKNNNYNLIVNLLTHKIVGIIDYFDTFYTEAPQLTEVEDVVPIVADAAFLEKHKIKDVFELLGYYYENGEIVRKGNSAIDAQYQQLKKKTFKYNKKRIKHNFNTFIHSVYNTYIPLFCLRAGAMFHKISLSFKRRSVLKKVFYFKKQYAKYEKKTILDFYKNKEHKYFFAACLLTKDENEYLEEFLDENYAAGVEHFYIYDNKSAIPVIETLKKIKNGFYLDKCDVELFTDYSYMQFDCYKHCLEKYGKDCKWITFIDTDEMVESLDDKHPIKDYLVANDDKAFLWIPWILYNSNGHIDKPKGKQKDVFTKAVIAPYGLYGKCIIQPHFVSRMFVHYAQPKYDTIQPTPAVQLNKTFYKKHKIFGDNPKKIGYTIAVRHYICRSYEEWVTKMSRGTCDPIYDRKFKEFFMYNPDLYYLTQKDDVKKKLNEKQLYDND